MADASGEKSESANNDYVIIREIYDNDNASEEFEMELDRALETEVETIIIEPTRLGDETARWIQAGNCLHKTAVLSGLVALGSGLFSWSDKSYVTFSLGFTSVICTGVYTVSWQFDPCCKYQVEYKTRKLQNMPLYELGSSAPVVLVRKDDTRRKVLHTTVSLLAAGYCGWKIYQWYLQ